MLFVGGLSWIVRVARMTKHSHSREPFTDSRTFLATWSERFEAVFDARDNIFSLFFVYREKSFDGVDEDVLEDDGYSLCSSSTEKSPLMVSMRMS